MRMAAIGAERKVARLHRLGEAGGNRLLAERQVAGSLDQVLEKQVVGALLRLTDGELRPVELETGGFADVVVAERRAGARRRTATAFLFRHGNFLPPPLPQADERSARLSIYRGFSVGNRRVGALQESSLFKMGADKWRPLSGSLARRTLSISAFLTDSTRVGDVHSVGHETGLARFGKSNLGGTHAYFENAEGGLRRRSPRGIWVGGCPRRVQGSTENIPLQSGDRCLHQGHVRVQEGPALRDWLCECRAR